MTDDLDAPDVDAPALGVNRLLGGVSGLQPNPRAARLGYASGGGDRVSPPETWDVADGYGDATDQSTYLKDLIHLGLPNGDFAASDADDTDSDFWELTDGSVAWAVVVDATAPGGYVLRYAATTSASVTPAVIESARVPVADVYRYVVGLYFDNGAASSAKVECRASLLWYDEAGTLIDTTSSSVLTDNLATGDKQLKIYNDIAQNTDLVNAAEVAVSLSFSHIAAGVAANVDIRAVVLAPLKPGGMAIDPDTDLEAQNATFLGVTIAGSGANNGLHVRDMIGVLDSISIFQYGATDDMAIWFHDPATGAQEMAIRRSAASTIDISDGGTGSGAVTLLLNGAPISGGGGSAVAARVRRTSNQSINDSADTIVVWESETYDEGGVWTAGTPNRFTIAEAGKYHMTAGITFAANATGRRDVWFIRNGTTGTLYARARLSNPSGGTQNHVQASVDMNLSVSDYVQVYVYQDSGGALDVVGSDHNTFFAIHKVGGPAGATGATGAPGGYPQSNDADSQTIAADQWAVRYGRVTITTTDRLTLSGNGRLVVSDLSGGANHTHGIPWGDRTAPGSVTLASASFIQQVDRLSLGATDRATLTGTGRVLILTPGGPTSRLVLAGRSR
jgi:hypothetical protein